MPADPKKKSPRRAKTSAERHKYNMLVTLDRRAAEVVEQLNEVTGRKKTEIVKIALERFATDWRNREDVFGEEALREKLMEN